MPCNNPRGCNCYSHDVAKHLCEFYAEPRPFDPFVDKAAPLPSRSGAVKFDGGKIDPTYLTEGFPRAFLALAAVCDYGFRKYGVRGGWRGVENGIARYSAAEARHELMPQIEGPYDSESGLAHMAHRAWNLLAVLEKSLEAGELEIRRGNDIDPDGKPILGTAAKILG